MSKITVKLSYSIMDAWARYRYEDAVGMYLGKPLPDTPEITLGRLKHEIWENHIKAHRRLPDELGGDPLTDPRVEVKWEKLIPMGDLYQILLRGRIDVQDGTILHDHKCGLTEAVTLVDGMQFPYYKLLQPDATEGRYNIFNPYNQTNTVGIRFLDDRDGEDALEHLITFGSEMIDYLQSNRQLINYKPEIYSKA